MAALNKAQLRYPAELPITARRDELLETIEANQVVIVAGETGSGKSTQLPKMCLELGRGENAMIGHTQPRRIAARSVAERVAEELATDLGDLVGYTVRFTDKVSKNTRLKLMTDGILLAEMQRDRLLKRYDTIIIDEAHERSLNIDFLLGYLAQILPRRPDLKVIVTSATIDTERFSAHFNDAPIVTVSGRTYPVETRYRPFADDNHDDDPDAPTDQPTAIAAAVTELYTEIDGDILVFCSGEREIRDAVDSLVELGLPQTEIVPLYARLSAAQQHKVFEPHKGRRVVVATNVAETSLTVPGIRAVVDPGTARISRYSRRTKVQRLPIEDISQASANQRSGRCGRLAAGICIRLYTEDDFNNRPEFTEPEITRTNLASVILQMAALGLGDIEAFPFVDPPDSRNIRDGVALLEELDAVNPEAQGTKKWLTPIGRQLAKLPLDPRLGRMLLAADQYGCLAEMLIITSGLAIQDPRDRPKEHRQAADEAHKRFADPDSDFLGFLHLWDYIREQRKQHSSSKFRRLAKREFLHYPRIREWQDIHSQLRQACKDLKLRQNSSPADPDLIHQAVVTGLLSHVGTKDKDTFEYNGTRQAKFAIAPGSALFKAGPKWVVAAELVETNRLWARVVCRTRPELIEQAAEHLVKRSYTDPHWDEERGAAVAKESVTLYGLPLVGGRTVMWGRVNEPDARDLFIRHALLSNEWDADHDFMARNLDRVGEVHKLEAKLRKADMVAGEEQLVEWFDQRLPPDITSTAHFNHWWKKASKTTPDLLDMSIEDLVDRDADLPDPALFPDVWVYGDLSLPLHYEFDPGSPTDGLTIDIPASALKRVDADHFDWLVPGWRTELVATLIKSMPKQQRKAFVPVPETIDAVLPKLQSARGPLAETVRGELARWAAFPVTADAILTDRLPLHLRPNYRVVSDEGTPLATGGDLVALAKLLERELRSELQSSSHALERTGATDWTFGDIPKAITTQGVGHEVTVYPALVDEGDSVGLKLVATKAEQRNTMWAGTRKLLMLNRPGVSKPLRALLTNEVKLALLQSPYGSPSAWFEDLMGCAVGELMVNHGAPAWTEAAWVELLRSVRAELPAQVGKIGATSATLLAEVAALELLLDATSAPKFSTAVTDVRYQLEALVYPGFLTGVGAHNLPNVVRYVEAMHRRIKRLPEAHNKDTAAMARVHALEREHNRLGDLLGWTPEVEDIAWQLQELRVSLFAQAVGAKGQVSEKRVRTALAQLDSGLH